MKTKIEAEIEIPDGFEFDRIEDTMLYGMRICLRKKKPKTRWFRALKKRSSYGDIVTDTFSGVSEKNKTSIDLCVKEAIPSFIDWITPWTEYEI